ncbi:MAG: 16S rRNA (cytosine(1402)-N(4))-methyltransferase [Chloroflexota bacterium]
MLEAASLDGRVLGLDADDAAIARVPAALPGSASGSCCARRPASSRDVAPAAGFSAVDGMLFDLGLSSFQPADTDRGFGFLRGRPLDMRFDTSRGVPAEEVLATLTADELAALFRKYGEEPAACGSPRRSSPRAPRRLCAPPRELAALVEKVVPGNPRQRKRTHPATRVFQALRIAVNGELDALEAGLQRRDRPPAARRPPRWSCPTTRWRTGSSSSSSTRSGAAASACPKRPSASAAGRPACAS